MKGRLPKLIEPHQGETALSVMCRLAEVNRISPGQLAKLSGIGWHNLRCGVDSAVERLAEVSGASFNGLRQATPRLAQPRSYDWLGCRFHDSHIRARILHVCPACIREDLAAVDHSPWIRQEWIFRVYRSCHIHGCKILEVTSWQDVRQDGLWMYLNKVASDDGAYEHAMDRNPRTALESYVSQRLRDTFTGPDWIDGLPVSVVAETSEMVGAFLSQPAFRRRTLVSEDWQKCAQQGYEALSLGPDHLSRCLETHIATTAVPNALGYTKLFGSTYPWLLSRSDDPDFAPVIDIIRQLAHRVLRADYPVPFLGGQIPPVDGCTVVGLAARYKISNRTVRRILKSSDVEPQGLTDTVWGQVSVYADAPAKTAMLRYIDEVDGRQARHLLGATQAAFDSLIAHNVIRSVMRPVIRGPRYSAKKIKKLRRDLVRSVHSHAIAAYGVVSLAEAARRIPVQVGALATMLLSGQIHAAAAPGKNLGFGDLRVDIHEVRDFLSRASSHAALRTRYP